MAMRCWRAGERTGEKGEMAGPWGQYRLKGREENPAWSRWRPGTVGKSSEAEDLRVIKAATGEKVGPGQGLP